MTDNISKRYSRELEHIANKLSDMEQGRIYEISKVKMDGYLSTNITQLKKMISELIYKIEYGEDSIKEELSGAMSKIFDNSKL